MNRAVPDEIVEEIRSRSDIVELINSYVPLKKAGAAYKACCPFHSEKTPSFTVTPQRQRYHCFGCGAGGDVFKFVMEREGVDFPTAIHMLATRCGVVIPEREYSTPEERQRAAQNRSMKEKVFEINKLFAEWFMTQLRQNADSPVAQYFRTREIPNDVADTFMIGAAPDSWDAALNYGTGKGYTPDELLTAGIVTQNEQGRIYDRFRNRLVFTILDEQGRPVAFSARTVEKESQGAKYVNSPETPVFRKSEILYGLYQGRQTIHDKGFIILCEGQIDTISMHRAGFANAVAPQGTAFTDQQGRILKRYADKLYVAFDSDSAGQKASCRAIELLLPLDFELKVINMPPDSDPDEIYRQNGPQGISSLVSNAIDWCDFLIIHLSGQFDQNSPAGKTRIINAILPYIQKIESRSGRESYARHLAEKIGMRFETIFQEMRRFRGKAKRNNELSLDSQPSQTSPATSQPEHPKQLAQSEKVLLELAIHFPTVGSMLIHHLPPDILSNTPIGQALDEAIRAALDGDSEHLIERLNDLERENPNPELSAILAKETDWHEDIIEKAVEDCIATIRNFHHKQRLADLKAELASSTDPQEKSRLFRELMQEQNRKEFSASDTSQPEAPF